MWNNFIKITDFSPAFMSDMFMTRKFNRKRFSLSIFILLGKNFFFKAFWIKAFHLIFTVFALNSPQRPKSEARSTVDGVHMWEPRWANVSREEKWSCSHIRLAQLFSNIYCLWQDNVPKCHFKEEKTENLHTYHSQKKKPHLHSYYSDWLYLLWTDFRLPVRQYNFKNSSKLCPLLFSFRHEWIKLWLLDLISFFQKKKYKYKMRRHIQIYTTIRKNSS